MNFACTATTRKNKENNELCMIGYPHNSSNRCQDPIKLKAKTELRTDETLSRTGNRITPPTARVKQSEWLPLKLPLQTCPVSSKIHLSIKQFTKFKFGSFRTTIALLVQLSSIVWIQRLKHSLADNMIDKKIQIQIYSATSIESSSLLH